MRQLEDTGGGWGSRMADYECLDSMAQGLRIGGDAGLRDKVADSGAILSELGCAASEGGNAPVRKMRPDVVFNPNIRSIPMAVPRPSTSSSIVLSDLSDAAAEAVARVLALFDDHVGSGEGPDDFEAAEQDALAAMKEVSCLVLRSVIEGRDDGAPPHRAGGAGLVPGGGDRQDGDDIVGPGRVSAPALPPGRRVGFDRPVDESLGLVNGCLTRTAAHLGVWLMGHCTAREAEAFFRKVGTMTPSASTLQRLVKAAHGDWEAIGETALDEIRAAEGIRRLRSRRRSVG